jgi:hypothetical protein
MRIGILPLCLPESLLKNNRQPFLILQEVFYPSPMKKWLHLLKRFVKQWTKVIKRDNL